MSWSLITTRDLEDARHAELVTAVREEALGLGQSDPLPNLIQATIDEMRACIAQGGREVDTDTARIAGNLKPLAVQKIARVMKGRLGHALTDDERSDEERYQKRLDQLISGTWPVDATATPATSAPAQPVGSPGPSIAERTRYFTRDDQDGL